jgi:hypothetical protein
LPEKGEYATYSREEKDRINQHKKDKWKIMTPARREKRLRHMSDYAKIQTLEKKKKVIAHYSKGTMHCMNPKCEVPGGAKNIWALTLDHINGGGKKQERELKTKEGKMLYDWLIQNNFPPEMENQLQVLCYSCQAIKRVENQEGCIHKTKSVGHAHGNVVGSKSDF